MKILTTIDEVKAVRDNVRSKGLTIGFVPTMGALHSGHLSLIQLARQNNDIVIASIFVNPTQFGPNEDFAQYPRTLEQDRELLESEQTDYLFLPSKDEIYPNGASSYVTVEGVSESYEGAIRPGHFRGVATVVSILFHIVEPNDAYFGQKDAQQLALIRKMTRDLRFPINIVRGETIREADGLAMSSRNRYLNTDERTRSKVLYETLLLVKKQLLTDGDISSSIEMGKAYFHSRSPNDPLDYLDLVDSETFAKIHSFNGIQEAVCIIAARIGTTRLLDNIIINTK